MTAWMQTPETMHRTPPGVKWFGQLTIPRELSEKDGLLIQRPIREIEAYRKDPVYYDDVYTRFTMMMSILGSARGLPEWRDEALI